MHSIDTDFEHFGNDDYVWTLEIDFVLVWNATCDFFDDIVFLECIMVPDLQVNLVLKRGAFESASSKSNLYKQRSQRVGLANLPITVMKRRLP